MDKEINKIISDYIKIIKEEYPDIESVYIFGSYAKGHFTNDSDIDLAIIFKDLKSSQRFDTQVQLMLLASQIDSRIEPHPLSHEDFHSGKPFANEIKKTGIELFEESLS